MEFAKLSSPSLKDLFVQQLQGMILSGALPVGTQLPPERTLAGQMQVRRTVVNSGLAELSEQGFLEVRPRQGACVADYRRTGNLSTLIAIMHICLLAKAFLDKSSPFAYTICGKRQGREAVPLPLRFRERLFWCEAVTEAGRSRPRAAQLNAQ